MTAVDDLRSFNRFYTRQIGLLDEHLSNSPFSLPEARVLYELATSTATTAAQLSRVLGMDKGYLSRLLARFRSQGLVTSRVSPDHAKHRLLALTPAGRRAFAALERGTVDQMKALLAPLDTAATTRLAQAMHGIQAILTGTGAQRQDGFTLRSPKPGDLGWVIHRQAVLYAQEYGWDWTYEGLISDILGKFISDFDAAKEQAWIAEHEGKIAGSIFLVRGDDPSTGRLRLLYVEPAARGLGIGKALVAACVDQARRNGFRELTLWTQDVLLSAHRIYEAAGFRLISEEPHRSFGQKLVGQHWLLDL